MDGQDHDSQAQLGPPSMNQVALLGMPDIPPVCGAEPEGTQRTLSAYNLFVREMLRQFKESFPDMPQGEHLRKVGVMWRGMNKSDRAKWRADGEFGSRVPGSLTFFSPKTPSRPSPYQMFVKGMTAQMRQQHPENKQSDNIKKIGELWRAMSEEEKEKWKVEDGDDGAGQAGGGDNGGGGRGGDAKTHRSKEATAGGKMKRKKDKKGGEKLTNGGDGAGLGLPRHVLAPVFAQYGFAGGAHGAGGAPMHDAAVASDSMHGGGLVAAALGGGVGGHRGGLKGFPGGGGYPTLADLAAMYGGAGMMGGSYPGVGSYVPGGYHISGHSAGAAGHKYFHPYVIDPFGPGMVARAHSPTVGSGHGLGGQAHAAYSNTMGAGGAAGMAGISIPSSAHLDLNGPLPAASSSSSNTPPLPSGAGAGVGGGMANPALVPSIADLSSLARGYHPYLELMGGSAASPGPMPGRNP